MILLHRSQIISQLLIFFISMFIYTIVCIISPSLFPSPNPESSLNFQFLVFHLCFHDLLLYYHSFNLPFFPLNMLNMLIIYSSTTPISIRLITAHAFFLIGKGEIWFEGWAFFKLSGNYQRGTYPLKTTLRDLRKICDFPNQQIVIDILAVETC